ncbi:CYP722 protein [Hibiscus syriacus]|uniref:CYP722 protein n=1 Tax=Hibiscus syriacus TaxID=106335 RepID=A0A6A2WCT9_HIBSY|nr:uncharacterized protein LOC120195275 [Hibiscus syriacus]KAE8656052.1 CYP722 protein [Hibiscus syriacus]
MDSFEFDNVKAEKEDALWRYNMEKKLRSGLQFIGVLLVLFFTSCSLFPTLIPDIIRVAGDLRLRFDNALNEPLPIFIILNIIILIVCVLSSQKQTPKQSDIYNEYVGSRQNIMPASAVEDDTTVDRQIVAVVNAVVVSAGEEVTTVEKQIVLVENAVAVAESKRSISQQKQQQPSTTSLSLTVTKPKPVITSTEKVKQKEYRRTRSVLSESGNQRPRFREFKRSETAMMDRELMVSSTQSPRKSLDEMSNDEFRLIVDSFIAERRNILIQENCMSIVVKN